MNDSLFIIIHFLNFIFLFISLNPLFRSLSPSAEEVVTKKKTELTTTRHIETRVKRQIVLEDGKVVEDSGPIVETNTTEDTNKQESESVEVKDQIKNKSWKESTATVDKLAHSYQFNLIALIWYARDNNDKKKKIMRHTILSHSSNECLKMRGSIDWRTKKFCVSISETLLLLLGLHHLYRLKWKLLLHLFFFFLSN